MKKYKCLAVVSGLFLLSACAVVTADEESIAIRHSAENNVLVQSEADKHCSSFGRKALKVQESPVFSTYFVRTVVSTFKCVKES